MGVFCCSLVSYFYLSRMFHTIRINMIHGSLILNILSTSLPTNECKTNQFCSNGLLFIQFSDAFQCYLTFISENIECCQGISRLLDPYILEKTVHI